VFPDRWIFRNGVLVGDAGQIASRPDSGVDHVARFVNGMLKLCSGRRDRDDGDV